MSEYGCRISDPRCKDHKFLEVIGPHASNRREWLEMKEYRDRRVVNMQDEKPNEWLT